MANNNRKEALRSLHRDGATFIFRHKRLLVGWHVWENNRTEAWLRELTPSEASSEHTINDETDWYRTYTSSDGSEKMLNDVMDVNEVHPALLEPHDRRSSELFLTRGRKERLEYLMARYKRVTSGRCKFREQEGGELKATKLDVLSETAKSAGQKRKREDSSSEVSECDTSNQKRFRAQSDADDDDENLPDPKVKDELKDFDEIDQDAAGSTTTEPPQQRTTAIADMGFTPSSRAPEPELLISAQNLKTALLGHISRWAVSDSILKLDLRTYTGELYMTSDVAGIATASQSILQHVTSYGTDVGKIRATLQRSLKVAKASGMPLDMVRKQEELVDEYKETEKELQAVVKDLTSWAERLQAGPI